MARDPTLMKTACPLLASGWKLVYFGWKSDLKARMQCHFFQNYYSCNKLCDSCLAHKPWADPILSYTNFTESAAYWLTELSHHDYVRHDARPSPWLHMPGFRLETVFFDMMHCVWLGSCRVLLASCLGFWHKESLLGPGKLDENLKTFSIELKHRCKENQFLTLYAPFCASMPQAFFRA